MPDHTGLVQCGYCGTAITYHPPVEKTERKNVERLLEICKSAIDGSNYDEGLQYSNKVLEIDPENFDAWIYKAISAFWKTTVANNRYDEAMGYLNKAEQIDKDNPRIQEVRDYLTNNQINWFLHLGDEQINHGVKVWNIYASYNTFSDSFSASVTGNPEAKNHSQEYFVQAMNYFLTAAIYNEPNYNVLRRINLARNYSWIGWSSNVTNKIAVLDNMEQKQNATSNLSKLRKKNYRKIWQN